MADIFTKEKLFIIFFISAACMVGIAYSVLPHLVRYEMLKSEGLRYIPLTRESSFDIMNVHGGRYRDLVDGRILSAETDTYEHKDGPAVWPLLSAAIMAPFFLPFESIFPGIIITDFIFPILIFVSFFFIFRSLTESRGYALFASTLLMFFPQFPLYIPPASFLELTSSILQFSPVSPVPLFGILTGGLSYLTREAFIPGASFFLLALFFTYKAVDAKTKKNVFAALAGIFYGLLFYLYFYFWAFAAVFLGLFFSALLATKRYREARVVCVVGVVGLIVSIPFWISHFHLASLSNYPELIERMGPELGHGFRWFLWKSYIVVFLMTLGALWTGKKFNRPALGLFLAALAVAEIVVLNEQVITGFNIQSDHWTTKVFLMTRGVVWLTIFYYAALYLKDYSSVVIRLMPYRMRGMFNTKTAVIMSIMAIAALIFNVWHTEPVLAKRHIHSFTVDENLMRAYEWLNKNTPKDSVIMTPSLETNIDLPVYTHNRIFLARAQNSLASDAELLERLYITYAALGIGSARLDEMIQTWDGILYFFTAKYRSRTSDSYLEREKQYEEYALPFVVREKILNEFTFFRIPERIPYRIDYIFIGPREQKYSVDMSRFSEYDIVYNAAGVTVYKWKK